MKDALADWARVPVLALRALTDLLLSVARMIARLFGMRGPAPLGPLPLPDVTAGGVREDLKDGIEKVLRGDVAKPCFQPGYAVHTYASAAPEARTGLPLGGLTEQQAAWLLSLTEADLERLAKAGPAACQRAVDGRRCGIVGLSKPGERTPEEKEEARELRLRAAIRDRILQARGVGYAPAA